MDTHFTTAPDFAKYDGRIAVLVPVYETGIPKHPDWIRADDIAAITQLRDAKVLRGKADEAYALPVTSAPYQLIVTVGCGQRDATKSEGIRRSAGKAVEVLRKNRISRVFVDATDSSSAVSALIEGLMLAQYSFKRYKMAPDDTPIDIDDIFIVHPAVHSPSAKEEIRRTIQICENTNWARDLGNMAPNELTPKRLACEAKSIAEHYECSYEFLDEGRMTELGMNALLGVARGSDEPPRLIILQHHHATDAPTLAIVGKGVTFDTGGISIKPADHMHEMKFDMCGAAAVLGAMKTVVQTRPPVNVVCVVPSVENTLGAKAQRPGDIVRAYNKKTIEVLNTDAEGRLILADALAYTVDQYKPDMIVDAATLTGACVVALGHYAAGVTATSDALFDALQRAADTTDERIWRMPLWDDYAKLIEGTHADLSNIGPPREAGVMMGGCFLKEFVGDTPWAHLDIAGTAWGAKNISYLDPNHASGYGVRLLSEWIRLEGERAAKPEGAKK